VQANGDAVFFTKQNSSFVLYAPTAITAASFSALPVTAFGLNGTAVDGTAGGTDNGTLSGSATTGTGLLGTTTSLVGTLTDSSNNMVSFNASGSPSLWAQASSLATVAGSYTASFSVSGVNYTPSLKIDSSGNISGTDTTTTTCTYGGSVTTPDTTHNDYNVSLTASCLTGTFTGIGAFFPAGLSNPNGVLSTAEFKVGLTNGSTTGIYLNLIQ
jgi:hypothetical protein